MYKWTPEAEGSGFAFTETLAPLEKFRDRVNIVSNLAHPAAGGVGSLLGSALGSSGSSTQAGQIEDYINSMEMLRILDGKYHLRVSGPNGFYRGKKVVKTKGE